MICMRALLSQMFGNKANRGLTIDTVHKLIGQTDVEDVRLGLHAGLEDLDIVLVSIDALVDFAVCVVQIANHARATHAAFHAGGQQTGFQAVFAEGAFVGSLRFVIDEARVVGAGLHAVAAAHAALVIDKNDPVGALKCGLHRADGHARRFVAVVA